MKEPEPAEAKSNPHSEAFLKQQSAKEKEKEKDSSQEKNGSKGCAFADAGSEVSAGDVMRTLLFKFRTPRTIHMLVIVGTYKMGELMSDVMFKPFLIDHDVDMNNVVQWTSVYGMGFSIAGSAIAAVLTKYMSTKTALVFTATARIAPQFGRYMLAVSAGAGALDPSSVIGVIVTESFSGGALSTVLFAFMMAQVDHEIGATHMAALSTVELLGKAVCAVLSGYVAEHAGYANLFLMGSVLSAACLCCRHIPSASVQAERRLNTHLSSHTSSMNNNYMVKM